MSVMEEERELIPVDEQVEGSVMIVISRTFDQAVLFVGQVNNSIEFQIRLSILSALIDNNAKVKEILKEESLKLDHVNNEYFFGNLFEEKLAKINSAKQKSKSLFNGASKKANISIF